MLGLQDDVFRLLDDVQDNVRELEQQASLLEPQANSLESRIKATAIVLGDRAKVGGDANLLLATASRESLALTEIMFDGVVSLGARFFKAMLGEKDLEKRLRDVLFAKGTTLGQLFTDVSAEFLSSAEAVQRGLDQKHSRSQALVVWVTLVAPNPVVIAVLVNASYENESLVVRATSPALVVRRGTFNPYEILFLLKSFNSIIFSIFPVQQHVEFEDPLNKGSKLPIFDFHLNDAPSFTVQYRTGHSRRTSFGSLAQLAYDVVFALNDRQVVRLVSALASPAISAAKSSIPNVETVSLAAISIGNDRQPIFIDIYGRGSSSKHGCRGYGSCLIKFAVEHRQPNLSLFAIQQGAPHKVNVWGKGWTCEIGDWLGNWKSRARDSLRNIRIPSQVVLDQVIPNTRDLVMLGRPPFLIIAFNMN